MKSGNGVIVYAQKTNIVDKTSSVDANTLNRSYFCFIWNMQVCIESGLVWYNACNNGSTQSLYKFQSNLTLGILEDENQPKLHINVPHSIAEEKLRISFSNVTNRIILRHLIDKKI